MPQKRSVKEYTRKSTFVQNQPAKKAIVLMIKRNFLAKGWVSSAMFLILDLDFSEANVLILNVFGGNCALPAAVSVELAGSPMGKTTGSTLEAADNTTASSAVIFLVRCNCEVPEALAFTSGTLCVNTVSVPMAEYSFPFPGAPTLATADLPTLDRVPVAARPVNSMGSLLVFGRTSTMEGGGGACVVVDASIMLSLGLGSGWVVLIIIWKFGRFSDSSHCDWYSKHWKTTRLHDEQTKQSSFPWSSLDSGAIGNMAAVVRG